MRNFRQIAHSIDVAPVLSALSRHPELWDQNTLRTTHPGTAHAQVSDIWLHFNATDNPAAVIDDRDVMPYPAWHVLPQIRPVVFGLMRLVDGVRLGRTIITRLPPGKVITPHVDGGSPATYYERYHVALQSLPGALFHAGDETVNMTTGEAWWFDNTALHSVENGSADDRIVLICDIRSE